MRTFYDDCFFDYRKFWQGRKYEDRAERLTIRRLLKIIPQRNSILDAGGGFGRLAPEYASRFDHCLLLDPSAKLLSQASRFCKKYKNIQFKRGLIEKLPLKEESFEVVLSVRMLHHLKNPQRAIKEIFRVLTPGGYLILEFANKFRFKNWLRALIGLDFDFFTNHRPLNITHKKEDLPFLNYHPNQIKTLLLANGFKIIKTLSVSNFRYPLIKKFLPLKLLLLLEAIFSFISSYFSPLRFFGPSIFILAQKRVR